MVRQVIGVDPGYVNYAICKIGFNGFDYNRETLVEMPRLSVFNLEIWDLQGSFIIRPSEVDGGEAKLITVKPVPTGATTIRDWMDKLNQFITDSAWIHEKDSSGRLPRVTVENQCGHIKNKDYTMFKIARATEAYIKRLDKKQKRIIGKSARKYGIKSDGSLIYSGRKCTSVEIVRNLLTALGLFNWIRYLDSLIECGQKIDDICDAILLALQVAIKEYEEEQKKAPKSQNTNIDNSTYPKLLSVINTETGENEYLYNESDSDSEDSFKQQKPTRKKKTATKKDTSKPKKTTVKATRKKKRVEDEEPSPDNKKRRRTICIEIDQEEEESSKEKKPLKTKAPYKEKKTPSKRARFC